jgi:methylmalonyl-CoA mutase cobalamin-binding subunit
MTLCGELLLTAQEYMSINSVDDQYYRKKIVARAMSLAFRVVKRGELSTPEEILEEMIREMS